MTKSHMEASTITIGKCTAQLSEVEGINPIVGQSTKFLTHLFVEPENRNQGHAKKFMFQLCKEAKEASMTILVQPDIYEECGIDNKKLVEFYKSFGFVDIQDDPHLMVLWPNVKLRN